MKRITTILVLGAFLLMSAGSSGASQAEAAEIADFSTYRLEAGDILRPSEDFTIIASGDIVIDGDIISDQPKIGDGYAITIISENGDIIVNGAILASSGVTPDAVVGRGLIVAPNGGDGGDIRLLAPKGRVDINKDAQVFAGSAGHGADAIAGELTSGDGRAFAGNGGAAGNVILAARAITIDDALVAHGAAGDGGYAYAVGTSIAGHGSNAGLVLVDDGVDVRSVAASVMSATFVGGVSAYEFFSDVPAPQQYTTQTIITIPGVGEIDTNCPPKGTNGKDETIRKGGDGGCAYNKGGKGGNGAPGAPGKDDESITGKCTHGGNAPNEKAGRGGAGIATAGNGGSSTYGAGGDGGDAAGVGGAGGTGGQGGRGGNGGKYGNGCDGGDGGPGGDGGIGESNAGSGGNSVCQNGGDSGGQNGEGGAGGDGGSGGSAGAGGLGGSSGSNGDSGNGGNAGDSTGLPGQPGNGPILDTGCKAPISCNENASTTFDPCETPDPCGSTDTNARNTCEIGTPCDADYAATAIDPCDIGPVRKPTLCEEQMYATIDVCNAELPSACDQQNTAQQTDVCESLRYFN